MQLSQRVAHCSLSPMRKFHPYAVAAAARGTKIYHLNIGQPDIETPAAFFDALRDFDAKVLEYAASPGQPQLIDAIVRYYQRLGADYTADDILITTGGSEALMIVMMCLLDPGSEILIPEPFYPNYATFITAAGGHIVPIPTSVDEGYRYADRQRIESRITPNTRAILMTNPGNPTGTVLTREEMRLIADIAKEHGLYIISDEVYREFCYLGSGLTESMSQFRDIEENLILIDSVSKRFSACGARVGCLVSKNRDFIAQALKFCQARLSVATLDQVGAAALYSVDAAYFAASREEYRARRDTVLRCLRQIPGVQMAQPDGAFYLMAALPVDDADAFQTWLLTDFQDRDETVMFAPGEPFYATPGLGKNEIRIAYVLKQERLERAIELLGLGLAAYNR